MTISYREQATRVECRRSQSADQIDEWGPVLQRGLEKLRATREWTQHDLAQRSGLHRRTIMRLEHPEAVASHPTRQSITALARAFGYVHVSDLWIALQRAAAASPDAPLVVGERVRQLVLAFLDCSPRQQQVFEGMILTCAALQRGEDAADDKHLLEWLIAELRPQ